ncbi:MAG: hypothetical protein JXR59_02300, partial [Desulfuromonadaceae bacterium]|nr:hypothetical protein [Desulfuromonadaceae bacterium]
NHRNAGRIHSGMAVAFTSVQLDAFAGIRSLAHLGSKRLIGQDALAPFAALKREAEKVCLSYGTRYLGGYAIPEARAAAVISELEQIGQRFAETKQQFLRDYDSAVGQWIAENPPQWRNLIRKNCVAVESVAAALQYQITPLQIHLPVEQGPQQRQGLFNQLCHEIRQLARSTYKASYDQKSEVTRKALRPVVSIRQKLEGLVFLDSRIGETLEHIDTVLSTVPDSGPIAGSSFYQLCGLLSSELAYLGLEREESADPDGLGDGQGDQCQTARIDQTEAQSDLFPAADRAASCGSLALRWDF